ncbi:MAG: hypothetical protein ACRDPV_01640 [Gaiellaceae bacterium]
MPLYEIVLRYPEREKVVLSEIPLQTGKTVEIAGRHWLVFDSLAPSSEGNRVRFVCRPTDERSVNGSSRASGT